MWVWWWRCGGGVVVAVGVVVAKTFTEMVKIVGNDDDNTAGVVLR